MTWTPSVNLLVGGRLQPTPTVNPKLAAALAQAQAADALVQKNTTHGFSPKNLGIAARDLGVGSARLALRAPLEVGASVGALAKPNYGAGVKLQPGGLLAKVLGSEPITPLQQQGIQTAEAHPGGFKAGPVKLSPTATGLALVAGKFGMDVGAVKGAAKAPTKLIKDTKATQTAVTNAKTSTLLTAIDKAQQAKAAGKIVPPSAIDNHINALPKEVAKPTTTPTSVPKVTPTTVTKVPTAETAPLQKMNIPTPGTKISGVSKNIEARAIEAKLAPKTGFEDKATFNPKTHAEENAKIAQLVSTDPERAMRIAQGTEQLPSDIHGGKLLNALEVHAHQLTNADESASLLRNLAKSPLATEVSETAQKLGLNAGRDPNSAVAKINDILKSRADAIKARVGSVPRAINDTAAQIEKEIKSRVTIPSKQEWSKFIEEIKC